MENKFTTDNLNVGDKVIVHRYGNFNSRYFVGTITKKTPTGLVDVKVCNNEIRFKKTGYEYSRSHGYLRTCYSLEFYTEERGKEIERANWREKAISYIKNKADFESLNDNALSQILRMFGVK